MISAVFASICAAVAGLSGFLLGKLWRREREHHTDEALEVYGELTGAQVKTIRALEELNDALRADIIRESHQVGALAAQLARLKSRDSGAELRGDFWFVRCPRCKNVHHDERHVRKYGKRPFARCDVCEQEWLREPALVTEVDNHDWMKVCPECGWEHRDDSARVWMGQTDGEDRCKCLGCKTVWSKEDMAPKSEPIPEPPLWSKEDMAPKSEPIPEPPPWWKVCPYCGCEPAVGTKVQRDLAQCPQCAMYWMADTKPTRKT